MKFDFSKSREDFQNKFQEQMTVINQNLLYVTHQVDSIYKLVKSLDNELRLQKQVDDYFDNEETSPQTDVGEQK